MKKVFFLLGICFALSLTTSAAIVAPTIDPPELYSIGHGVKVPMEQLLTLTPKEYRKLTGHRLGLFKSLALKAIQKKLAKANPEEEGTKSQAAAAIICFFLGGLGIHRFYLGYTWQGVVQLLTAGGLGIWWLIDFVRILTGDLKPKNGSYKGKF